MPIEPFNEAKYKALLEGLEISEILKSTLERTLRIDSEFYNKENLTINAILSKHRLNDITQLVKVSDGNHIGISDNFIVNGVPYYRGQNIHNYFIEESNPICIDINTFNLPVMKRSHLKQGDVLLSIVGTIGGVALVSSNENATCNCKLAIFRPEKINGYFLSAFLKSKYGQNQIKRFTRGAVQMGLILEDMNQIMIPIFSNKFQNQVKMLVKSAKEKTILKKQSYLFAETLLLDTLGLQNFTPSTEPINVKSFKDSFLSSGRLDAEYYQKKYEQIVERIKSTRYEQLSNLVKIKKSIEPGSVHYSESGLPFIRVSDYDKFGLSTPNKYLSEKFCQENANVIKKLRPKKETILFSKDGSVGTAYMLRKDGDFITSGAILYLTVRDKKQILPEYLTLVLNSILVQMQAERDAGGSIILHWRVSEIENVVIPIIEYEKQKKIADLVEESFQLKKQSEELLEAAKRAVEIAIEQNEEKAMKYLEGLE
jgi:restriction endonuclease S subunit